MKKKGFTLIELLVVVAIMAMLAAMAVVALNTARARARDARRVSDIKQIQTALELYYLDQNTYPASVTGPLDGQCLDSGGWGLGCSGTTYMASAPTNPRPVDDGGCSGAVATNYYTYAYVSTNSYQLGYCIGSTTGNLHAGFHRATPAGIADP